MSSARISCRRGRSQIRRALSLSRDVDLHTTLLLRNACVRHGESRSAWTMVEPDWLYTPFEVHTFCVPRRRCRSANTEIENLKRHKNQRCQSCASEGRLPARDGDQCWACTLYIRKQLCCCQLGNHSHHEASTQKNNSQDCCNTTDMQ